MSDPQPWISELLEAWRTNNRINLFLIDHISDEGMKCTLSKRGGRNVVRQFCHLHNVRVWHLEARAKELSKSLYKFGTEEEPDRDRLKENLVASGRKIEEFLEQAAEVSRQCPANASPNASKSGSTPASGITSRTPTYRWRASWA